jgi:outer membrane protein
MKKLAVLALTTLLSLGVFQKLNAQRMAYVDTKYILENIPEYQEAEKELDQLAIEWQKQLEKKYEEIDKMYKNYQAEQILLTEDMKRKREEEIIQKEKEAKEFQKQKFGVDGELFKKRQELIKPIQDKVYNAIQDVAKVGGYDFIFDKATGPIMIYAKAKYNVSDDVLKKLGYSPKETN